MTINHMNCMPGKSLDQVQYTTAVYTVKSGDKSPIH